MIVWPATLPQKVLRQGFKLAKGDGRLQSPMEAGNSKSRLKLSYIPIPITARTLLTEAQVEIFDDFWESISKGVKPFQFPSMRGAPGLWVMKWGQNPPTFEPEGADDWILQMDLVWLP